MKVIHRVDGEEATGNNIAAIEVTMCPKHVVSWVGRDGKERSVTRDGTLGSWNSVTSFASLKARDGQAGVESYDVAGNLAGYTEVSKVTDPKVRGMVGAARTEIVLLLDTLTS